MSHNQISEILHINRGTIPKFLNKCDTCESVADRLIKRYIPETSQIETLWYSSRIIAVYNIYTPSQQEMGLFERKSEKKTVCQKKNSKNRLSFTREPTWSDEKWELVLFNDEKLKFNLFENEGKGFIIWPIGQQFQVLSWPS